LLLSDAARVYGEWEDERCSHGEGCEGERVHPRETRGGVQSFDESVGGGYAGVEEVRARRGMEGSVGSRKLEEDWREVGLDTDMARGREGAFGAEQRGCHDGMEEDENRAGIK
jgi:hypothetical protein